MDQQQTWLDTFRYNPVFFLLAAILGGLGLVWVVLALVLVRPRPRLGALFSLIAVLSGIGAFTVGTIGNWSHRSRTDQIVTSPGLTPGDIARLRESGYADGQNCLRFGLVAGAIPFMIGGVLGFLGFLRMQNDDRPA
jgi:hypothetical protein